MNIATRGMGHRGSPQVQSSRHPVSHLGTQLATYLSVGRVQALAPSSQQAEGVDVLVGMHGIYGGLRVLALLQL